MGSDNNCNNYYNSEQNSVSNMSSSPYYQTLVSQNSSNQDSMVKNINNEWISTEQNSDANSTSQNQDSESEGQREQIVRSSSEIPNSRGHKSYSHLHQQHPQMSTPQWSFPGALGNSYQRFYGDGHYGIVITPTVTQQSSLMSTPSSSLHSLNSEVQSQNHNQHIHHMQTNQHLKKIYYQGLEIFFCGRLKDSSNHIYWRESHQQYEG